MTKLSVNINKIATLRNSRGGDVPNVVQFAKDVQRFGAEGVTILSLDNMKFFKDHIPNLLEVSIGHALIAESLYLGVENVIQMYLNKLK